MRKTYEERLNNVYPIEPLHSLPIENIEKSRRKIREAVKMYSQRIKDNYREFMIQRN